MCDHVVERAVPVRIVARRARKHLVPAREARLAALDVDRVGRRVVRDERAVAQRRECVGERGRADQREAVVGRRVLELGGEPLHLLERARIGGIGELQRGREQQLRFAHLQRHVLAGRALFRDVGDERRPVVAPCDHAEFMAAELVEHDARVPAIVRLGFERHFAPGVVAIAAPLEHGCQVRVPVREDRGAHDERLADHALDREAAAVDRWLDALDRDPICRERRGQHGALACSVRARRDGRRPPCMQQRICAGRERERLERGRRMRVRAVLRDDAREAARHAGQDRRGVDGRRRVEIGIQRDQQRRVVVVEQRAGAAQQRGCRRAGRAQLHDFAACRRDGRGAAPCVRIGERARQIETGVLECGAVARGIRVARHQRDRHAALEAHRHEPAGADGRGRPQRAAIRAGDGVVRRVGPVVGQARAVGRIGKRDRRADAPQQPVLVREPRRAQVPPAHR